MKIISIILLCFTFLFSCKKESAVKPVSTNYIDSSKEQQKSETRDSIENQEILKNPELLNYSKGCDCGKGNLTVNTKYYNIQDTLNGYKYIITDQELEFKIDNKVVKIIHPPYKHMKRLINNETINVPITDIYSIKCIQNKDEYIYKIYGGNIYDPPHEFFSLNDLNGSWLSYFYGDRYDTYDSFGDYELYEKKFGEQINRLNDMIQVIPDWL